MVKIEPGKPLPDHTKLDYDECCAKITLEELFPAQYQNLILADKPDLQGIEVGIEVTIADDRKKQEAVSNWVRANSTEDKRIRDSAIERMRQLGVEFTGGIQGWPEFDTSFRQIESAVKKKIEKLKSGKYRPFPRYELFVFTDIWLCPEKKTEADAFFFSGVVKPHYQKVYLFSQGNEFHIFDTENNAYKILVIDSSDQTRRNLLARQMVEEGERE